MPHALHADEADDELDRLFPDSTFTHLLTVVSHDQLGIAIEALSAIRAFGGGLDALRLTRVNGKTEQRLSMTGLRPQQARLISSHLAAVPGVERARVEHQIIRMGRAGDERTNPIQPQTGQPG